MMAKIFYDQRENQYLWKGTFEERGFPQKAGWKFSARKIGFTGKIAKIWWTDKAINAFKLIDYADETAAKRLERIMSAIRESRAAAADVVIPAPKNLTYYDYQKAGAKFLADNKSALLADEMGLGKTIQTIGLINICPRLSPILIVCPAHLKINWARELQKWLVKDVHISIVEGRSGKKVRADVMIINYDILSHRLSELLETTWGVVVLDEAHYIKNPNALRTKAVKKLRARRKIALTGTPILNRPIELWSILDWLQPKKWGTYNKFGKRYCAGFFDGYSWNFKGCSRSEELREKLRSSVMMRRLKAEVLSQLPPKRRQIVELPYNGREFKVSADFKKHLNVMGTEAPLDNGNEISTVMRVLGEEKAPLAAKYILDVLESVDKAVVFAWHTSVISVVAEMLSQEGIRLVSVTGKTSMAARQKYVDEFQNDSKCRVFIGNMQAAGVGLTLTAAEIMFFVEQHWVPGVISQAEDRGHRIGLKHSLLIQHLVLDNGLDALMAKTVIRKQEIEDSIVNAGSDLEWAAIADECLK